MAMKYLGIIIISMVMLTFTGEGEAGLSALEVAEKAYYIEDGEDVKSLIEMTIVESNGNTRTRFLAFGRKDDGKDNRSLIVFRKPADVKGTSFLTWNYAEKDENDQWLYLPALKKIKRISTSGKSKSFMGSDFSYEDMSKRSLSRDDFKLLGDEKVDGVPCFILESTAKDKSEKFIRRVALVRKDNFIIIKTDYYDAEGVLCKQFTAGNIKAVQTIPTVHSLRMENLVDRGYSTMTLEKVVYNTDLPDRMFQVQGLK
jgi:outer membrane lipoprotein-sorting protein